MSRITTHGWIVTVCILLSIAFSACSNGSGQSGSTGSAGAGGYTSDPTIVMESGTGAIVFQVAWNQPASRSLFAPPFNACEDYSLQTIKAEVSNGTTTVSSGSWPCSLHEGVLLGVPAGTNYTVQVTGLSSGGTVTTWQGQKSAITVNTGQVSNAGTVTMSYVSTDVTPPTVSSSGPHSGLTNTTAVPVTDRIDVVFSEPMAISTISTDNISLTVSGTPVTGTVRYNPANNTAAFIPSATLTHSTEYVLQVVSCVSSTCIKDTAGRTLASNSTLTFTTDTTPGGVPSAPTGLTATAGNGQVTLDWLASSGSVSFDIYYGTSSGVTPANGTKIADVRPPYVHLGRTNGQPYYYIVTAVNDSGDSAASSQANATPTAPGGTPLPPSDVTLVPETSKNTLSWTMAGSTTYNLYWSTSPIIPNKYSADHVVRGVISPYVHTGLSSTETYCYIITAVNSTGESVDSKQNCQGYGSLYFSW